jgi:eukaryotic-like serine/threonine-protein kinase
MATSGSRRLGKYEILEVVGRGGMGVVYKAVDPEIGRLVAIKMMTSTVLNNPGLRKCFYREAQAAGKLQHPNIVTIHDLGVQEATPYLVMEFLQGDSLDTVIDSHRTLSLEEKLNVMIQICNALAYAHDQSIVHRDIKPGNVVLLKDGNVKIVDFGIARMGGEKGTFGGQLMGSIQYMSPEQIDGSTTVDFRTDIFSTGVLLYQLLTYVLPFEGKDAGDTLLKIVHGATPSLGNFLSTYPLELDSIVHRALAKNPDERYQTASDLAFDLLRVQEGLKRERVSKNLQAVELSVADGQWGTAEGQLLQLLKIDRQNVRANELLREVQQQIRKQQHSERIRNLKSQAEQALARNALDEAVRYLDVAASLDQTNSPLCELRDSIKARKQRADTLNELVLRARTAFETGDLEDALASAEQALAVDVESADARELRAAITGALADRDKLEQVQFFLDEARKQISSRHFTAALDLLKKAKTVDPEGPGINELTTLASTGQQQERRRRELEQLSAEIEEAFNRNEYTAASNKAAEGLQKFPNDRGLLKLKAQADRERGSSEKRMYLESRVSLGRRLLEEKKPAEALVALREALDKYPNEFVLQSMYSLITESIERERAEQFRAKIIQQAKEAIRRKAYAEAIEILQAARLQAAPGEFDDMLQFVQDEAANYATQQKIDAAAEKAHHLMSGDEYGQAIELLEFTLQEIDDEELRIILANARRHVEEFNAGLQEVIATTRRLLQLERHNQVIKLLETHAGRYGKSLEFSHLLADVKREQHRVQAFSVVKEQVRDALDNSDFGNARAVLDKYCEEFGDGINAQPLRREIETKQEESARTTVAQVLKDCRVLLLVRSYQSVLNILDGVSSLVPLLPAEMKQQYESARATATAGAERGSRADHGPEKIKRRPPEGATGPSDGDSASAIAPLVGPGTNPVQETQVASSTQLDNMLGGLIFIPEHQPGDGKIQSPIDDLGQQVTVAASGESKVVQEIAPAKDRKAVEEDADEPSTMGVRFVLSHLCDDGTPGQRYQLDHPGMIAGQKGEIELTDDPLVAAEHVRFTQLGAGVYVEDLGSPQGVYLSLRERHRLKDGDTIQIGEQRLRFFAKGKNLSAGNAVLPGGAASVANTTSVRPMAYFSRLNSKDQDADHYELKSAETSFGRSKGTYTFPDDRYLSAAHARIKVHDGQYFLEDLASGKGTFVRIRKRALARDGDTLMVGKQLLRVLAEGSPDRTG